MSSTFDNFKANKEQYFSWLFVTIGFILYFIALYEGKDFPLFVLFFITGFVLLALPIFFLKDDSFISLVYSGGTSIGTCQCANCKKWVREENSETLDEKIYCKACFEWAKKVL